MNNMIIDYFNMCAEQYLWYSKGLVSSQVWKAWKSGIIANLRIEIVNSYWLKEIDANNTDVSYYGLVEEIPEVRSKK